MAQAQAHGQGQRCDATDFQMNWENSLTSDRCARVARQRDNDSVYDYNTFNFFNEGDCQGKRAQLSEFAYCHPNLRFRDGYGIASPCVIAEDSAIRYNAQGVTHERGRQQLLARSFYAVPNFGRGGLVPNTETFLKNGLDTTQLRQCDRITERNFDRFEQLLGCGEEAVHREPMLSIGQDSRQIMRQARHQACQQQQQQQLQQHA